MKSICMLSALLSASLFVGCGGGSNGSNSSARYVIADLGNGYSSSSARAVNNAGQVLGTGTIHNIGYTQSPSNLNSSSGPEQPVDFLYSDGKTAMLTAAGLIALNDAGQIVGSSGLYQNGALTPIPSLVQSNPGVTINTNAAAINNAGQVVGDSIVSPVPGTYTQHAVLYANEQLTDLGTLGTPSTTNTPPLSSNATAINDQGQIVGISDTGAYAAFSGSQLGAARSGSVYRNGSALSRQNAFSGSYRDSSNAVYPVQHAFVWQNGKLADLGTLGGSYSRAAAINNNGLIVGAATSAGQSSPRAVFWQNGHIHDIDSSGLTITAAGVNDAGQIVGMTQVGLDVNRNPRFHAFIYANGKLTDLNTLLPADSGWELTNATGINNKGQICGAGAYQGTDHAFLLTPR